MTPVVSVHLGNFSVVFNGDSISCSLSHFVLLLQSSSRISSFGISHDFIALGTVGSQTQFFKDEGISSFLTNGPPFECARCSARYPYAPRVPCFLRQLIQSRPAHVRGLEPLLIASVFCRGKADF